MNKRSITRMVGICISTGFSVFFGHASHATMAEPKTSPKGQKKVRPDESPKGSLSGALAGQYEEPARQTFPWRNGIVTTTFWIGEDAAKNNPVPNHKSSWDTKWAEKYGGTDTPNRKERNSEFCPVGFEPGQNPFYIALPYNDMTSKGHKEEASKVIPWFREAYQHDHKSVLKGRWVAVRYKGRIAYAQWEDCGPFRTDHWQYVFGNERPKPNLNRGAGLDVSPAVRDYLGMADTDVTDWKFVEFEDVPPGPWARYGENNTFVQQRRAEAEQTVAATGETQSSGTEIGFGELK